MPIRVRRDLRSTMVNIPDPCRLGLTMESRSKSPSRERVSTISGRSSIEGRLSRFPAKTCFLCVAWLRRLLRFLGRKR